MISMLEQYLANSSLVVLLTFSQLALPQESPQPKSRDVLVKENIEKLSSAEVHVAAQAALDLGYLRATEAVPAMLRMLRSSRLLSTIEHTPTDKNGVSLWVATDVRAAIINSLGLIGDPRAVPALKKYLKKPLVNREVFTGNVAHALYQITGKSFAYLDYDGVPKNYVPSPLFEEEFRKRSRPDLTPTNGLTASLEIAGHGYDVTGAYWLADRPLVINLGITNQSKKVIEIDASADNFLFSSVGGEGTNIGARLPAPEADVAMTVIKPGETLRLRWVVGTLKDSPLSRGWVGYVNIKCVYTNPRTNKKGAMWRGERLVSNTVERYYYAAPSNKL